MVKRESKGRATYMERIATQIAVLSKVVRRASDVLVKSLHSKAISWCASMHEYPGASKERRFRAVDAYIKAEMLGRWRNIDTCRMSFVRSCAIL